MFEYANFRERGINLLGDLHCHTKLSDGSLGLEELIMLAKNRGVETIAITDHDCLAGTVRGKIIGKRYGVVAPNIVASALEKHVRANAYINVQVACWTVIVAGISPAAHVEYLLVTDTCGNCNVDLLCLALSARTAATSARRVNYFTLTVTSIAGTLGLNNSERCALADCYTTRTAASRAGFGMSAFFGACAVTFGTSCYAVVADFLFASLCGFLKRNYNVCFYVAAAHRGVCIVGTSAAEASENA